MANFILESAILQEAQNVKIIKPNKARFRMIMQTVDEENKNHRIYPKLVIESGLKECSDKIKNRKFLGEMDHPLPIGNQQFDSMRQTQVKLTEVSHMITNYEINGNNVIGELETTSTENGYKLLGLLQDRAGIGVSMRGLAEVEHNPRTGIQTVKSPIHIVTYDTVSSPSHVEATVNFSEMTFESKLLWENRTGLIWCNGKCYQENYFDKLIETTQIKFFERWV